MKYRWPATRATGSEVWAAPGSRKPLQQPDSWATCTRFAGLASPLMDNCEASSDREKNR